MKLRGQRARPVHPTITLVESEDRFVNLLNSKGIPSLPGKAVSHAYADIVSWGCVLLEVKASKLKGRRGAMFTWAFTAPQIEQGLRADLIILECEWAIGQYTYHIFQANDERFYNKRGLKGAVTYTPNRKSAGAASSFTKEVMEAHQDCWEMITAKRVEIETQLRNGQSWRIHDRMKKGA